MKIIIIDYRKKMDTKKFMSYFVFHEFVHDNINSHEIRMNKNYIEMTRVKILFHRCTFRKIQEYDFEKL